MAVTKPFTKSRGEPPKRVEIVSLGLTQEEVDYLVRAMEVDYRRICAWMERTTKFDKAQEIDYRMKICASLMLRLKKDIS